MICLLALLLSSLEYKSGCEMPKSYGGMYVDEY